MIFVDWNLNKPHNKTYDANTHAFIISCHNSSDVIEDTLKSLLKKVKPHTIYVADNGSSLEEQNKTKQICYNVSLEYSSDKFVNYGYLKLGNKTISQYATVRQMPDNIKYCTLGSHFE